MINYKRLIIWSIIGTGISSVTTQLLTIREFLSQFHGNEITISLVIFCWLLLTGIGSLAAKAIKRISIAGYSLLVLIISLWLMSKAKNYLWAIIPFGFMFVTTIAALIITGYNSFKAVDFADVGGAIGNIIAGGLAVILIVCALILAWDGIQALLRFRSEAEPSKAGGGD